MRRDGDDGGDLEDDRPGLHDAARVLHARPEQGWTLLCNGVVVFDDTGEILPDRRIIAPHRPQVRRVA